MNHASALSLEASTPAARAWESAYLGNVARIEVHAKGAIARHEARKQGRKATVLPAGRPGTTAYTLSGYTVPATVEKTGAHKGEYRDKSGRLWKSKAHAKAAGVK